MRRFISLLMLFFWIFSATLPAFANEPPEGTAEENSAPQTLLDLIQSVPLEEIHERLTDPSAFDSTEIYQTVQSTPILPVYTYYDWADHSLSFDERLALVKKDSYTFEGSYYKNVLLVIPGEDPFSLAVSASEGEFSFQNDYPNGLPRYLQDIIASPIEINFLGKNCTVTDLICFDDFAAKEDVIFFRTDKGDFVRVYSYWSAEPYVDYRMEDFQVYAKAYYELISSYDYNYDENGSGKGGGGGDFISFTKEYEPVSAWEIFFLCLGAAVVLGTATAITVFPVRNKKPKAAK